jgi:DNA polymerase III delta prime subunit
MLHVHETIVSKLNNYIIQKKIPNLLFHGVAGSGKKTILFDFLKSVYGDNKKFIQNYIMTVNCAHGKGIKFIREDLKFFAKTNIDIQDGNVFKSIVLLNADKLTIDAQSALRRCIELFNHTTRFFIVVDDKYKILRPILSRFCEIYVPEPTVNDITVNLHKYNLEQSFPTLIKTNKQRKEKFKSEIEKIKHKMLPDIIEILYEKGFSSLDITEYIKDLSIDEIKKYEYVVFIQKIKREFRDEKLLMGCILHFLLIRSEYNLENISFM